MQTELITFALINVMESVYSCLLKIYSFIFNYFINSPTDWFRMKSFHTKLLEYKSRNKSRFDLNRVQLDATPIENGILPHVEEQVLEYPNHVSNNLINWLIS